MSLLINYDNNKITSFSMTGIECRDFLKTLYDVWVHSGCTDKNGELIGKLFNNDCAYKLKSGAP